MQRQQLRQILKLRAIDRTDQKSIVAAEFFLGKILLDINIFFLLRSFAYDEIQLQLIRYLARYKTLVSINVITLTIYSVILFQKECIFYF